MAIEKQFLAFGTQDLYEANKSNVKDTSLAFVEESGEEKLVAQGKEYDFVPSNGGAGQFFVHNGKKGVWKDYSGMLLDQLTYGVMWLPNVADPTLTRIGNMSFHKTLPIQSQMKGAVVKIKGTTSGKPEVQYWLDDNDWRFRADAEILNSAVVSNNTITNSIFQEDTNKWVGMYIKVGTVVAQITGLESTNGTITFTPESTVEDGAYNLELGACLNGHDGEVMVYVPKFYIKSYDGDDERWVRISEAQVDETWQEQPAVWLAAYRDTVLNTVPTDMGYLSTLSANSAISVVNTNTYCRGGNNTSDNDSYLDTDPFRTQLGKCRTSIGRATMREDARLAGKEVMSYRQYKNILYWLWVIEYATFNSQDTFNAELTSEGFHQGGMGEGLTSVDNWQEFNSYYPITPSGFTNDIGNGTGVKLITSTSLAPVGSVYATRWRGIENPFGDIWHNVDGIIINSSSIEKDSIKFSEVYTTDNPDLYSDSDYALMEKVGEEYNASSSYIKEFDLDETAEIIPRSNQSSSTQYKCDRHYVNSSTGLRTLVLGGNATNGASAGLGDFHSNNGVGNSNAFIGFRTSLVIDEETE